MDWNNILPPSVFLMGENECRTFLIYWYILNLIFEFHFFSFFPVELSIKCNFIVPWKKVNQMFCLLNYCQKKTEKFSTSKNLNEFKVVCLFYPRFNGHRYIHELDFIATECASLLEYSLFCTFNSVFYKLWQVSSKFDRFMKMIQWDVKVFRSEGENCSCFFLY